MSDFKMMDNEMAVRAILDGLQKDIYDTNFEHGWFDDDRTFGDDVALLHSEVSEAFEAFRHHGLTSDNEEDGKPEGVGSEFADILIRLLDSCERYNIDLTTELLRKMRYNENRPYRHGGKTV